MRTALFRNAGGRNERFAWNLKRTIRNDANGTELAFMGLLFSNVRREYLRRRYDRLKSISPERLFDHQYPLEPCSFCVCGFQTNCYGFLIENTRKIAITIK